MNFARTGTVFLGVDLQWMHLEYFRVDACTGCWINMLSLSKQESNDFYLCVSMSESFLMMRHLYEKRQSSVTRFGQNTRISVQQLPL